MANFRWERYLAPRRAFLELVSKPSGRRDSTGIPEVRLVANRVLKWSLVCLVGLMCGATIATAQSPPLAKGSGTPWAMKMFGETNHDFGVVARGSEVKTRIKVTNLYEETVRISSVTPSCSCTRVGMPDDPVLDTYESTYLELSMDTLRFRKHKDAVVTVRFSQPRYAEVKIPVQMYVRPDVVLQPGAANFGNVEEGTSATRTLEIAFAGFPDESGWKILEAKTSNPHLTVELKETSRTGGGTQNVLVNYQLTVQLKPTAPQGPFRGLIQLVTNDTSSPRIPVIAEARIEGEFTVTPSKLMLGTIQPGATKNFNVVIRGQEPFEIEKIECDSDEQPFATKIPEGKRPVHVIPLRFTAPDKPGVFKDQLIITLAGRKDSITLEAIGRIVGESNVTSTSGEGEE